MALTGKNLKLNLVSAGLALPFVLSYYRNPSPTAFQQAATWLAWAGFLWILPSFSWRLAALHARPALQFLGVMAAAVLISLAILDIPTAYSIATLGALAAASVLVCAGAGLATSNELPQLFAVLCRGLVLAGMINAGISVLQIYQPELLDGSVLAQSLLPGRSVGNLRQPNHLAYLLVWSLLATAMLYQMGKLQTIWALAMSFVMAAALVLSASRTGLLSLLLLVAWAVFDSSAGNKTRRILLLSLLWFTLAWMGSVWWSQASGAELAAQSRIAEGVASPPRWLLIRDSWALISQHPWFGVGWGEFNFAWTLTPMASRSGLHFDHTHNLVLQWLVELGVPMGLLLTGLLFRVFWLAWRKTSSQASGSQQFESHQIRRASCVAACLIVVPSLLEYPLWYAYFLFPVFFWIGVSLFKGTASAGVSRTPRMSRILASAFLFLAVWLCSDIRKAQQVFDPMNEGDWAPLSERLQIGRTSVIFPYAAEYMGATRFSPRPEALTYAERAAHGVIDTWLLQAWAASLHSAGEDDKARYLVLRLKEFNDKRAHRLMAPCMDAELSLIAYQCAPQNVDLSYSDFRRTRF